VSSGKLALDLKVPGSVGTRESQQMKRWIKCVVLGLVFPVTCLPAAGTSASCLAIQLEVSGKQVILTGRAICLEPSGRQVPDEVDCSIESVKFSFHSSDGHNYSFVSDDALTAMFTDHRVRQRELQVTAWQRQNGELELVAVRSIKGGKLYDIYYYCDICNITAYAPGPCPCCRRELEFKETPAAEFRADESNGGRLDERRR